MPSGRSASREFGSDSTSNGNSSISNSQVNNLDTFNNDNFDFEQSANPVGELLELTTKLSLRPPEFVFNEGEGPPHDRIFTCHAAFASTLGEVKEFGRGRSKKIAKRHAAFKLLKTLSSAKAMNDVGRKHEKKTFTAGGELSTVPTKVKSASKKKIILMCVF
jgi:hypothetical protein